MPHQESFSMSESIVTAPTPSDHIDKSESKVCGMFTEIASRYDFVNRLLSCGIDVWWRHVTVSSAPPPPQGSVLDVCTGTGDLAMAYAAKASPGVRIVGSDFCRPMLSYGMKKSEAADLEIEWVEADATELPFLDNEFDVVSVAFGLRNIVVTHKGLSEMARVLKPGGRLAILEFSLPSNKFVRSVYLWYFRHVLPFIGNRITGNHSEAYTYLNKSVEEFPSGNSLKNIIESAGFRDVAMMPLTFGIATLSVAIRDENHA